MDLLTQTIETVFSGTDDIKPPYGCKHYLRMCRIKTSCCNEIFNCKRCHDEFYEYDKDKPHKLDINTITSIICNNCNKEQTVNKYCIGCGICFGMYYCQMCILYDDIDKGQYHCEKCNICRLYKTKSFHCNNCNICLNVNLKDNHKCSNVKDSYCPVCMEYMFDSTKSTYLTKCGHVIHYLCLIDLLETSNKCPICAKSIMNLPSLNKLIDLEVEQTLMPEEYRNKLVDILCNDCNEISSVNFHIVAMKCLICESYNTKQI